MNRWEELAYKNRDTILAAVFVVTVLASLFLKGCCAGCVNV